MTDNTVVPSEDEAVKPATHKAGSRNVIALILSVFIFIALITIIAKIDWQLPKFGSSSKAPPASTQYPVCLGAENSSITFKRGETKKVVKPQEHCFGPWVNTPPGSTWRVTPTEGRRAEILLWDGSGPYGVSADTNTWLGEVHRAIFRVRGADSVIVTVSGKS